ncbi:hypothetical protein [Vibrio sp. 10N.222.49.C12]|uniref:hypothetical protein n=1 Tax=Vibrio sp. 10N.222.49.C12 TaxID=3229614 RepID=UPI003552E4C0
MARPKFDGKTWSYALCKKEAVERWLNDEFKPWSPRDGIGEGKYLLEGDERGAKDALSKLMRGVNPFKPIPLNYTRRDYIKKLEPAYKCLYSLYRGERKTHLLDKYGKQHTTALDEWLVSHLSGEFGLSRSGGEDSEFMSNFLRRFAPGTPTERTNAELVELMLVLLEIGGAPYQFGSIKLCEDSEWPINRIKN